jgi:hypothetical protein
LSQWSHGRYKRFTLIELLAEVFTTTMLILFSLIYPTIIGHIVAISEYNGHALKLNIPSSDTNRLHQRSIFRPFNTIHPNLSADFLGGEINQHFVTKSQHDYDITSNASKPISTHYLVDYIYPNPLLDFEYLIRRTLLLDKQEDSKMFRARWKLIMMRVKKSSYIKATSIPFKRYG